MTQQQPCTLADVIHAAPQLLSFLPGTTRSAVSGCSRQLRLLIRGCTNAVYTGQCKEGFASLVNYEWPQLHMVVLSEEVGAYLHDTKPAVVCNAVDQLVSISICDPTPPGHAAKVVVIQPEQTYRHTDAALQSQLHPTVLAYLRQPNWSMNRVLSISHSQLSAEGIAQLVSVPWPNLDCLRISHSKLRAEGIAKLVAAPWPKLRSLVIHNSKLGALEAAQLAKGQWPRLRFLTLSNNQLDAAAVRQLVFGDWPRLFQLRLCETLDAEAMSHLGHANWANLKGLQLQGVSVDADFAQQLVHTGWTLWDLDLNTSRFTFEGVAKFAQAEWPLLRMLLLCNTGLHAAAIAVLVAGAFPELHTLDLSKNKLNGAAVRLLAEGNWPKLTCLSLEDTGVADVDMLCLSKGDWPVLGCLQLAGNCLTAVGLQYLSQSGWTRLCKLDLDTKSVSAKTWQLLSLEDSCRQKLLDAKGPALISISRQSSGQLLKFWPRLRSVDFVIPVQ